MRDIHEILNCVPLNTDYERAVFHALGIIRDRANYYNAEKDYARAMAYDSAADILSYAMEIDWSAMNQYDYNS